MSVIDLIRPGRRRPQPGPTVTAPKPVFTPAPARQTAPQPALSHAAPPARLIRTPMRRPAHGRSGWTPPARNVMEDVLTGLRNLPADGQNSPQQPPAGSHPFDASPASEALAATGTPCPVPLSAPVAAAPVTGTGTPGPRVPGHGWAWELRADKTVLPVLRGVIRHRGWSALLPVPQASPASQASDPRWDNALALIGLAADSALSELFSRGALYDAHEALMRRPLASDGSAS